MRLVTWNCFRGDAQTRAAAVADLAPGSRRSDHRPLVIDLAHVR